MDPSYNNGFGSLNSGGNQPNVVGGGNPPENNFPPNGAMPANGAGVATGGMPAENTNAFNIYSQMQNGNAGGGLTSSDAPVSSGTGDVVIGSAPEKKSRKGLITGLIVAFVVLVVVGVVAVIMVNGRGNETARDKFNRLINYVASGEASKANYTEAFSNDVDYYFDTQQANLENRETLYATTSALLDDFMNSYNKLEDKSKFSTNQAEFERIMKNEGEILEFARVVNVKDVPTLSSVAAIYIDEGREKAVEYLDSYYDFRANADNSYLLRYQTAFSNYKKDIMDTIDLYYKNNCYYVGVLDYSCMLDKGLQLDADKNSDTLNDVRNELDYYLDIIYVVPLKFFDVNSMLGEQQ